MGNVILFTSRRFDDNRGWFNESFNARREAANGIGVEFIQDNESFSTFPGTIRGIHYQSPPCAQSKLVRCSRGRLIDYAVDLRRGSPTYGRHVSAELSVDNGRQLFIPVGFGHAFITLDPATVICYKVDNYYSPDCDGGIRWDCPDIAIDWPLSNPAILSDKDVALPMLAEFQTPFAYDGVPMQLYHAA